LGLGDRPKPPTPNPQSPIPNPQSPIKRYNFNICEINLKYNYFYNNGLFI